MEKTVNFDLTGKVAIVTGGSRGLGVELATSMAEYGADIALMAGNVEKMKKALRQQFRQLWMNMERLIFW